MVQGRGHYDYSCDVTFVENTIFPPLNFSGALVANQSTVNVSIYSWDFCCVIDLHVPPRPGQHHLRDATFVESLKIVNHLTLFFVNIVLAILGPWHFQMNFGIFLPMSAE